MELLGQDMVIFRADNGVGSVSSKVIGVNNPGTPESALVDMRLLSECTDLVVTVGSSYGSVAAAWGGIAPVQMLHGLHKNVQVGTSPQLLNLQCARYLTTSNNGPAFQASCG